MGGSNGGYGPDNYYNDVWRSTDKGATWTQMTGSAGWLARVGHSSVVMPDGSIVLMGGWDGTSPLKNDVWRSTDKGATWKEMTAHAGWSPRYLQTSVVMSDGSIVLMGGFDWNFKNDVWRSTDYGTTWKLVNASAGWTGRGYHSSVVMPDGSIVLMGGGTYSIWTNDVWRSTDKGATWTQMTAHAGWSARNAHSSVVMPDGSILLMGGVDGSAKNDVWRSINYGKTWTQVKASAGWSPRGGHSSVVMPDGSIVLTGGQDNSGSQKNDVWRFMTSGSSAKNPSHTYTKPGIYNVALQAYNAGGYSSTRKIGYITVTSPSITVTSPNGGETWKRGTSQTVTWGYTGSPGPVKITLLKASVEIGTIAANAPIGSGGLGSYTWNINPSASSVGSDYKVSVQSTSQPMIKDTSNTNFGISWP